MQVLITAGATRNPVDAVRYLSAASSGRTGLVVARALIAAGLRVHVLGSGEAAARAPDLDVEEFTSTRDLMARMQAWVGAHPAGGAVHAAAVGDYELPRAEPSKIPSGQAELVIRLVPAPKIAPLVRSWGLRGPYVTFKAAAPETTDAALVDIARAQLDRTGSDRVFANVLGRLHSRVALVSAEAVRWHARRDDAVSDLVTWVTGRAADPER